MLMQRKPRVHDRIYLGWVSTLPCVISGALNCHVSHVRYTDRRWAKENPGIGAKPCDRAGVVPLRPDLHVDHTHSQHQSGERKWWERYGIDPHAVAAVLYIVFIEYADNPADRDTVARDVLDAWRAERKIPA